MEQPCLTGWNNRALQGVYMAVPYRVEQPCLTWCVHGRALHGVYTAVPYRVDSEWNNRALQGVYTAVPYRVSTSIVRITWAIKSETRRKALFQNKKACLSLRCC